MNEEKMRENAEEIFDTICTVFDNMEYQYTTDLDQLVVETAVKGDDLIMPLKFVVHADKQLVSLYSLLPFDIPDDKKTDVMFCLTMLNNNLYSGSFDFDFGEGKIIFRITNSFMDSTLSEALFAYMLDVTTKTVDDFNDKLFMLATGVMDVDQFIKAVFK